jgi:hypothetical protein
MSDDPKVTNLVEVPDPSQLVALTDALTVCLPNLKLMPHAQLAATLERMLLKRGFRILPESREEHDERQN